MTYRHLAAAAAAAGLAGPWLSACGSMDNGSPPPTVTGANASATAASPSATGDTTSSAPNPTGAAPPPASSTPH